MQCLDVTGTCAVSQISLRHACVALDLERF